MCPRVAILVLTCSLGFIWAKDEYRLHAEECLHETVLGSAQ